MESSKPTKAQAARKAAMRMRFSLLDLCKYGTIRPCVGKALGKTQTHFWIDKRKPADALAELTEWDRKREVALLEHVNSLQTEDSFFDQEINALRAAANGQIYNRFVDSATNMRTVAAVINENPIAPVDGQSKNSQPKYPFILASPWQLQKYWVQPTSSVLSGWTPGETPTPEPPVPDSKKGKTSLSHHLLN
jgi:hypothetical protein